MSTTETIVLWGLKVGGNFSISSILCFQENIEGNVTHSLFQVDNDTDVDVYRSKGRHGKIYEVGPFSILFFQIKLLFGPLFIQLVLYILTQLFTSVSVNSGGYPPLFTDTEVNNC